MWNFLAHHILTKRPWFIAVLLLITIYFGWHASKIELSYDFVRPLPATDSALINYDNFKKLFGEDGAVMVIGLKDSTFFKVDKFNDWFQLTNDIKKIKGIKEVMSVTNIYNVIKDDSLKKFKFNPILNAKVTSQQQLDSIHLLISSLRFYKDLLFNDSASAHVMLITFDKNNLNSKDRITAVNEITTIANVYQEKYKTELHYSGMPFIRTQYMIKVSHEMFLFLFLAILVTAIILFFIFKSFRIVAYCMVVVVIGIIWSLGTIELFNYKITILSGLIPPLITVIGLPNCVFIINKYLIEMGIHGNRMKAAYRSITKVSLSNFLANLTTAIGFGVFYFTHSSLLVEFGVVAALNVMATYTVALILIPIILSFLPLEQTKHTLHLKGKIINSILKLVDNLVHHHRKAIYTTITVILIISVFGWRYIELIGYVVDDLPKRDPIYTDLRFFEKNFNGVMPFEVSIDTKDTNGIFNDGARTLYKIHAMQKVFAHYPEFSKPVSLVEGLKFANQSFHGGKKKFYVLPTQTDLNEFKTYVSTFKGKENKFASFLDSTKRYTRISFQMADCGSFRMKQLIKEIQPKVDSIFPKSDYHVALTGNSLVFLKGNDYLFHHLFISLAIAIGLILLLGMVLFRSIAIIVLSKLPCLIPLVITAGIMGYLNIHFKPSTILIFSVAFGLASDGTIYILTEYWHQLRQNAGEKAISNTIAEVGISMIYTAIILFFGFAIFAASNFGGTVALGVLMSITIASSLATNLVMLPSILLSLEGYRKRRSLKR